MKIGFIGAGKVSTAFGRYLHGHGVALSGYFDLDVAKAGYAGRATQSQAFQNTAELAAASDIIMITTQDDQIQGACRELCRQKAIQSRHLVGHMSGAHASLILEAAAQQGAAIFSLHPMQAFAQEDKALADLLHTYFSLEGNDPRLNAVEAVLAQTGNRLLHIKPENKQLYHLAACIFSNYLVTLMAAGLEALTLSGIQSQEGLQAMRPLIQGTLANIERLGPAKALTGPIARGDLLTIQHHIQAMETRQAAALQEFYTFMGLKTLDLAVQGVLNDEEKADALRRFLTLLPPSPVQGGE
ncbi:MAG: DUF2520 domain-containing protein [Desulfobacteraceae bacterium]|nr:DUF2520 domain-containing protein [Desulfobacteraceae bacterium]